MVMSDTQRASTHSMFIGRQNCLLPPKKKLEISLTLKFDARLSQYSRERAQRQGSSMRLINLIHISPPPLSCSQARHCQSTKMRPLRAYQSSADKLIHHGIIHTLADAAAVYMCLPITTMMTLSYMHQHQ